ncbi:FAR1-related sequence 5-like protein [Tanacetum coccineum]
MNFDTIEELTDFYAMYGKKIGFGVFKGSSKKSENDEKTKYRGYENLPFTKKDCRNYVDKVKRLKFVEGDAEAIQGYFMKVQSTDREVFYAWELDEENTLKSLFWADARCRAAYEEFGDVVTSDATYLTNQYEMSMATFVRDCFSGCTSPPLTENIHEDDLHTGHTNGSSHKGIPADKFFPKYGSHSASPSQHAANVSPYGKTMQIVSSSQSRFAENGGVPLNSSIPNFDQLVEENRILKEKLSRKDDDIVGELLRDLERERKYCKELEAQIEELKGKCEHMYKEQESIIDIFAEERERRDVKEESLRKKLEEATANIQDLVEKVQQLERR